MIMYTFHAEYLNYRISDEVFRFLFDPLYVTFFLRIPLPLLASAGFELPSKQSYAFKNDSCGYIKYKHRKFCIL